MSGVGAADRQTKAAKPFYTENQGYGRPNERRRAESKRFRRRIDRGGEAAPRSGRQELRGCRRSWSYQYADKRTSRPTRERRVSPIQTVREREGVVGREEPGEDLGQLLASNVRYVLVSCRRHPPKTAPRRVLRGQITLLVFKIVEDVVHPLCGQRHVRSHFRGEQGRVGRKKKLKKNPLIRDASVPARFCHLYPHFDARDKITRALRSIDILFLYRKELRGWRLNGIDMTLTSGSARPKMSAPSESGARPTLWGVGDTTCNPSN